MIIIVSSIIQQVAKSVPNLDIKLKQAGMKHSPYDFAKRTLMSSLYMSVGISFALWMFLSKLGKMALVPLFGFPLLFMVIFFYFLRVPDVTILKKQREIDSEIVFAGRFLIIEIESGVPLYDAFKNISKNYEATGRHFSEIITKIDFGTEMEDALTEEINLTPSASFRKILWQIVNSQQTGADIGTSLKSVINNIAKEQIIQIKEYGRKLNPLAMFYMIIAVILPSIGITMFIVMTTFLSINIGLPVLLVISLILGFVQFMFLAMIKSSRPSIGI